MGSKTWTVQLFEARTAVEFQKTKKAADPIETFGVSAMNSDQAKAKARDWLKSRGHTVRTVNVSAAKDVKGPTLIVYVKAGSSAESRVFLAAQAAKRVPPGLNPKRTA